MAKAVIVTAFQLSNISGSDKHFEKDLVRNMPIEKVGEIMKLANEIY